MGDKTGLYIALAIGAVIILVMNQRGNGGTQTLIGAPADTSAYKAAVEAQSASDQARANANASIQTAKSEAQASVLNTWFAAQAQNNDTQAAAAVELAKVASAERTAARQTDAQYQYGMESLATEEHIATGEAQTAYQYGLAQLAASKDTAARTLAAQLQIAKMQDDTQRALGPQAIEAQREVGMAAATANAAAILAAGEVQHQAARDQQSQEGTNFLLALATSLAPDLVNILRGTNNKPSGTPTGTDRENYPEGSIGPDLAYSVGNGGISVGYSGSF
jgi:hypothetical protein